MFPQAVGNSFSSNTVNIKLPFLRFCCSHQLFPFLYKAHLYSPVYKSFWSQFCVIISSASIFTVLFLSDIGGIVGFQFFAAPTNMESYITLTVVSCINALI